MHAELAAEVLAAAGYGETTIERVSALVQKRRLKADPEAQCLEDIACLVFLELDLPAFARDYPEEKVIDVLRKTWRKMSERGREAALGLELPAELRGLVQKAVAG